MSSQNGPTKSRNSDKEYVSLQKDSAGPKKREVLSKISDLMSVDNYANNLKVGNDFLEKGEFDKAEKFFKKALNLSPKSYLPYKCLATTYLSQKKFNDALDMSIEEIRINPNEKAFVRIGKINMLKGDIDTAISVFENIIVEYPKSIESLFSLNKLYSCLKEFDKAASCLEKVIVINPKLEKTYFALARTYFEMGNYMKAEKNYLKYISLKPNDEVAHNNLGTLYAIIDEHEQAINLFMKVLEIDPKCSTAYANLGVSYIGLGRLVTAEIMFKQAIFLDPCDTDSYINLFNLFCDKKMIKAAKEIIIKGLSNDPNNKQLKNALATLNERINGRIKFHTKTTFH